MFRRLIVITSDLGTKFYFPSGSFPLITSYFPCDPRTINIDNKYTKHQYM